MKSLSSYRIELVFMLILCLSGISLVGCNASKNSIEAETIDVTLSQVKSVPMEIIQNADENNIDSDTDNQFDFISNTLDYSHPFVVRSPKNPYFYLSENYQNEYREVETMFNSSIGRRYSIKIRPNITPTIKIEATTIKYEDIDLETINKDYEIYYRDLPIYLIQSGDTFGYTENFSYKDEIPNYSKERCLYKVEPGSLVVDNAWLQVLEDYPSYLPIYEKENGDMYLLEKQTPKIDDPKTSSVSKYILHLLSSNDKTPVSDTNMVLPDNIDVNSFLLDLPWITYKHCDDENNSSTYVLNLETNQYLSFELDGIIDCFYPIKDGVIISTYSSVEDEDYKLGCRDYTFVGFDQKVTKLIPPEKYITLFTSSGSQNVLWMDATSSYVYCQIPSDNKEAVLLFDDIKIKEIIPTSSSSFWIIPYKSEIETNSEIILLKEENKHLNFVKCNLPIDLNVIKKEFFVDNYGYLIMIPKTRENNPSIHTISSDDYSLLTEYQLNLPEDIEKLRIETYLTSINDTRYFECIFGKKLTEESEIEVEKDKISGEILHIWITELPLTGMFECTFP